MQNLIMGKQLGCDKFFLLTNYVEKCIHLVADYGRVSLQVSIQVWAFPLFPVCIHCLAGVQLKVEAI